MRIRDTDRRKREWSNLKEATGEKTKAGAIDAAVRFYLSMGRVDYGKQVGQFNELMKTANKEGSLTAPEIADILDTEYLPVQASASYSVGRE